MLRTRDFVLLFSVLAFLAIGLGGAVLDSWLQERMTHRSDSVVDVPPVIADGGVVLGASTPDDTTEQDRADRLAALRDKVSQIDFENVTTASNEEELPPEEGASETQVDEVIRCTGVSSYGEFWDARGIELIEREGAILVERVSESGPELLLQLSFRTQPAASPSCLATEVIGIANDGSLIRNDERDLYAIFGPGTRIGYALDGFPIYGMSSARGDVCGGRLMAGQYRYELSADRPAIINCFAAAPAVLP